MLRCAEPHALRFHPFLDEPRSNLVECARTAALHAPDVAPAATDGDGQANLTLELADFGADDGAWASGGHDALVTSFFIDCAGEIDVSLRRVRSLLRPGGLWVFAGPLAYHSWPALCPTLEQFTGLAAELGLAPLAEPTTLGASYVRRPGGFGGHEHEWTAAFAVFRAH